MSPLQINPVLRRASVLVLTIGLAAGLLRAQSQKFEQARAALNDAAQAQQKQQGLANNRDKLFSQYPCPEVTLVKWQQVTPGGTLAIAISGTFPKGTTFLSDHDGAALTGSLTGNTFSGRLIVAPNQPPSFVHVYAFAPVSFGSAMTAVAFIGGVYSFDLRGQNGWIIKATPAVSAWKISEREADLPYRVEFYHPNEAKPFEAVDAEMRYSSDDSPTAQMSLSLQPATGGAQAQLQALGKQMSDPRAFAKLSEDQQSALIARMNTLQQQAMQEMMAAMQDPAGMQKKEDDFGCHDLSVKIGQPGSVSGRVECGRNVNNGSLPVTGTMTAVR